jgi:hypothetical protein
LFDSVEEKGVEYNDEIQGAGRDVFPSKNQISEGQGAVSSTGRNVYPEVVSEKAGTYKASKTKITSTDDLASLADANIGNIAQENLIFSLFPCMCVLPFCLPFLIMSENSPLFFRFASARAFPSSVRGPVDNPP